MNKRIIAAAVSAVLAFSSAGAFAAHHYTAAQGYAYRVVRHGMMISPEMLPGDDGRNINGPSVIRAPAWLKEAPGRYLMYFAHHTGEYIRLAYADKITGPWKIYSGGVMNLRQLTESGLSWGPDHVASPEVIVDEENRKILMYFHTPVTPAPKFDDPEYQKKLLSQKQETFLAVSDDGLAFKTDGRRLGDNYMRVFPAEGGGWWGFSRLGQLNYSYDGRWRFTRLSPGPIDRQPVTFAQLRHLSLLQDEGGLLMFYSKIADVPESILVIRITINGEDWTRWTASAPQLVLTPETDYEGAGLPLVPSRIGSNHLPERGLRDPYVIRDGGRLWLFYTVQGEKGIALAELVEK